MNAMTFCHASGLNKQEELFTLKKRHLHTDSQGKKPMTLFPFTLNYIIAYFLKSVIITPKILKTKNDRFHNQIRKGYANLQASTISK